MKLKEIVKELDNLSDNKWDWNFEEPCLECDDYGCYVCQPDDYCCDCNNSFDSCDCHC